jgi:hypothetical protein
MPASAWLLQRCWVLDSDSGAGAERWTYDRGGRHVSIPGRRLPVCCSSYTHLLGPDIAMWTTLRFLVRSSQSMQSLVIVMCTFDHRARDCTHIEVMCFRTTKILKDAYSAWSQPVSVESAAICQCLHLADVRYAAATCAMDIQN